MGSAKAGAAGWAVGLLRASSDAVAEAGYERSDGAVDKAIRAAWGIRGVADRGYAVLAEEIAANAACVLAVALTGGGAPGRGAGELSRALRETGWPDLVAAAEAAASGDRAALARLSGCGDGAVASFAEALLAAALVAGDPAAARRHAEVACDLAPSPRCAALRVEALAGRAFLTDHVPARAPSDG